MESEKKKSFMKKIFRLKGKVPDKGVQEGKKSINDIINLKRRKGQISDSEAKKQINKKSKY